MFLVAMHMHMLQNDEDKSGTQSQENVFFWAMEKQSMGIDYTIDPSRSKVIFSRDVRFNEMVQWNCIKLV